MIVRDLSENIDICNKIIHLVGATPEVVSKQEVIELMRVAKVLIALAETSNNSAVTRILLEKIEDLHRIGLYALDNEW